MSKTIEEQINELQRQKTIEDSQKKEKERQDFLIYVRTLLGKAFFRYHGMNSCGSMQFEFILAEKYDESFELNIQGKRIYINLDSAAVYGSTYFHKIWSDPEYRRSGGDDKWKTEIESAIFSKTSIKEKINLELKSRKYKGAKKSGSDTTNSVEITHYTPYNWEIKVGSQKEWEYYWEEIPLSEWNRIKALAEEVHNYIFASFFDIIQGKMEKNGKVLLHPTDKERCDKVIERLDSFLNDPGSKWFTNKDKAVQKITNNDWRN